jgi:L-malate glycosyltransferase
MAAGDRPLRVAYFVANYHRFTGGQRSLSLLVGNLDRRRVEPVVIMAGEGYCTRMFRELGVRVIVEEPAEALQEFGGGLRRVGAARRAWLAATTVAPYALRIARLLRRERVDLAHYNEPRGILMAGLGAKLARVPIVWHLRGAIGGLGRLYVSACTALPDRIIPVARALEDEVPARFRRKCTTIYNGIRPASPPRRTRDELVASLSPGLRLGAGDLMLVVVGSVVPFKGIHHLLDALGLLGELGRKIALVIVGDWTDDGYKAFLDARVARHGLERVRFAGWDAEPLDWFHAADVAVLPTVQSERLDLGDRAIEVRGNEGFPRAVLEAMSAGRAIVASRVAGTPEQIDDGVHGLLTEQGDARGLAAAIERLAGDPALRRSLGQQAAARLDDFSIPRMVERTVDLYRELVPLTRRASAA